MELVETMSTAAAKRVATATEQLIALAQKEVAGKVGRQDADNLASLLKAAEKTTADYTNIVDLLRQDAELAKAADADALMGKAVAKSGEIVAFDRETEKILEKRVRDRWQMFGEKQTLDVATQRARTAQASRDLLHWNHPEVFGETAPSLDGFTLTSHSTVINVNDPDAPRREVPAEVFGAETHRRCELVRRATIRAKREHEQKLSKWAKDERRATPEPQFEAPSWASIIASGLADRESAAAELQTVGA